MSSSSDTYVPLLAVVFGNVAGHHRHAACAPALHSRCATAYRAKVDGLQLSLPCPAGAGADAAPAVLCHATPCSVHEQVSAWQQQVQEQQARLDKAVKRLCEAHADSMGDYRKHRHTYSQVNSKQLWDMRIHRHICLVEEAFLTL